MISKCSQNSNEVGITAPFAMQVNTPNALQPTSFHYAAPTCNPPSNLSLHLLHVSSNPTITSPQTLAHSRSANRFSQFLFSNQMAASSLASASLRISTTISVADRKRREAREVVCRVMCSVSERYVSMPVKSVVEAWRLCKEERG